MNQVDAIARAVLYEGYLLYPYGASSLKNRQRFTFGGVYPPAFDVSAMQTQCLLEGDPADLDVTVRFLQLLPSGEAVERAVSGPGIIAFDGIQGRVDVQHEFVQPGLRRLSVTITNTSEVRPQDREEALLHTMLSTHAVLRTSAGAFVSMTDPPEALRAAVATCKNVGVWPVLVGEPNQRDTILASPIILEDYPRVADESKGDFFDATEVDELLSLSIMSLTDEEKDEMREDARTRQLLERTESLSADDLMRLHGVMRGARLLNEDGP
jgi:hypothetical protein